MHIINFDEDRKHTMMAEMTLAKHFLLSQSTLEDLKKQALLGK